jgi:hypothetical protein
MFHKVTTDTYSTNSLTLTGYQHMASLHDTIVSFLNPDSVIFGIGFAGWVFQCLMRLPSKLRPIKSFVGINECSP